MAALTCPPLRGGDAIFFWGTGFLSDSIISITHGPSHMAMVVPPEWPDQSEIHIIESTISETDDGVQYAPLGARVADYDEGGTVVAAYLRDDIRALLDWEQVWRYAKGNLEKRYNVWELGAYLLNEILPGGLQINAPDKEANVCSEFYAELLRAGGWPGLDPYHAPPSFFWSSRFWREAYTLKGARPKAFRAFNLR